MIYTSSSLALALLEILVHVRRNQLPDYVWISAEVPDELISEVEVDDVPSDPAEYGTEWLETRGEAVALAVPSVIIPEQNILLNPNHSDFVQIHWTEPIVLKLDPRLTEVAE